MIKKPAQTIFVTQPSLPNLDDYTLLLKQIWDSKIITNNGAFHQQFEHDLAKHLGVKYVSVFNNGTIALLTALQALEIKGEVITTPYSFIATANSLVWNNLTPVFCDVNPINGNLDANKIEPLITPNTSAILPVHVYGNPVDVKHIEQIANKHHLKVIYDAAHAFGVEINNNSVLNYGDLSILSFHATKAFNSVEGGAIISHTPKMKQKIDQLKNFGITSDVTVVSPGINGKMNELIAAYGILQLKEIEKQIEKRKKVADYYTKKLKNIKGIRILTELPFVKQNYSYYPIFIDNSIFPITRDELHYKLREHNIYTRRYFYPLISNFPIYQHIFSSSHDNLPKANILSNQVLCLPIYSDLNFSIIDYIVDFINSIK